MGSLASMSALPPVLADEAELKLDLKFREIWGRNGEKHGHAKHLLLQSLLEDGCISPLIAWKEPRILLDGYRRYDLCKQYDIPFKVEFKSFRSRDEALLWTINFGLAHRADPTFGRRIPIGEAYILRTGRSHSDIKKALPGLKDPKKYEHSEGVLDEDFEIRCADMAYCVRAVERHIVNLRTRLYANPGMMMYIRQAAEAPACQMEEIISYRGKTAAEKKKELKEKRERKKKK